MTLIDREALAYACAEHLKSGGDAITEAAFASGWQACAAHYAPKLTDEGFEEIYLIYATTVMDLTSGDTREGLKAALRAAGLRFKEEA